MYALLSYIRLYELFSPSSSNKTFFSKPLDICHSLLFTLSSSNKTFLSEPLDIRHSFPFTLSSSNKTLYLSNVWTLLSPICFPVVYSPYSSFQRYVARPSSSLLELFIALIAVLLSLSFMESFVACAVPVSLRRYPHLHTSLIFSSFYLDPPFVQEPPCNIIPAMVPQAVAAPRADPALPIRKRPALIPGLVGTNAAFLVPDNIRKKFMDGWSTHVPLTYLTNKGCLYKNRTNLNSTNDVLTIDPLTGQVTTTSKTLSDNGELELTFDEWHQAWRCLLDLIKTYVPQDFLAWEVHYSFILNSENRAEMWPLYLAYDVDMRRRAIHFGVDPSIFSIGVWNDLEQRYLANKVLSIVQSDLRRHNHSDRPSYTPSSSVPPPYTSRNPSHSSSFRTQHPLPNNPRVGRCIFCGDRSKSHPSKNCTAACYANGMPCHLSGDERSGTRISKTGRRYCYTWNGISGCDQNPCRKGEHLCTLCGTSAHAAQQCDLVL